MALRQRILSAEDEWRLRVGDWRVRFTYTQNEDTVAILVLRVLPRQGSYHD
jgi:mRNA-degrading endonuclease RelE of RelBE toxin-antitoxin system